MNRLYIEDIKKYKEIVDFAPLADSTILVTGANGLIASCFIDMLMINAVERYNIKIIAVDKNKGIIEQYKNYDKEHLQLMVCDVTDSSNNYPKADYVLHMASNTNPSEYVNSPISTLLTNSFGTYNLLKYANNCKAKKFLFTSSVEVYGKNNGDVDKFDENYCGYINTNSARACYPESKRLGEVTCASFYKEFGLKYNIVRIPRTFGAGALNNDIKATTLFVKKAVDKEDIILKSNGQQLFSFAYVCDVVTAIIKVLTKGEPCEVYNIAHKDYDLRLIDFANILASLAGKVVKIDIEKNLTNAGYSSVEKAMMENSKLLSLGWNVRDNIANNLQTTINILRSIDNK